MVIKFTRKERINSSEVRHEQKWMNYFWHTPLYLCLHWNHLIDLIRSNLEDITDSNTRQLEINPPRHALLSITFQWDKKAILLNPFDLQVSTVSSCEDPLRSNESATTESIPSTSLHVEDKTNIPRELLFHGRTSTQDEAIVPIWIASDDPPKDGKVLEEARSLPNRSYVRPINGTDGSLGDGGAEQGAQEY